MIFWIALIVLVVSITLLVIEEITYEIPEAICVAAIVGVILAGAASFIMGLCIIIDNLNPEAQKAKLIQQYNSLTYQIENDLYDNDNDLGKKELYDQIQEWNSDLAYHKEVQRDFWVGILYPNIYDDIQFIEYNK